MSPRTSGILCHPTSLPSPYGIGDLGAGCDALLDFLAAAGQTIWQVLPLAPTGYGDSPYQPLSSFAGNPLLIDPRPLVELGLLTADALAPPDLPADHVDYGAVIGFKGELLRRSFARWQHAPPALADELHAFEQAEADWLEDYALYMALKQYHGWAPWSAWPRALAQRQSQAMAAWAARLAEEVAYQRYLQFLFQRQWQRVRALAAERQIRILGDMPIFVGHDSADVWAHQELFFLDEDGQPAFVAGVPPDYFSPTGQLWGNPHYRWERMAEDGYAWWMARLQRVLAQVDMVRIDHFRGFCACWRVAAGQETAIDGEWVPGPGAAFFEAVQQQLGALPIIAEDLGLITPDVIALRQAFKLPGMKVLQFAFDSDAENDHLPHNLQTDCVLYTGTHDNDTTQGWYAACSPTVQHRARLYVGSDGHAMHWDLIRLAMTSVAQTVVFPLQDVLGLGTEARLNCPGRPYGNWAWRVLGEVLLPELAESLRELAILTGRCAPPEEQAAPGAALDL